MLEELDRLIDGLSAGKSGESGENLEAQHPLHEALLSGPGPREALLNLRKLVVASPEAAWPVEGKARFEGLPKMWRCHAHHRCHRGSAD